MGDRAGITGTSPLNASLSKGRSKKLSARTRRGSIFASSGSGTGTIRPTDVSIRPTFASSSAVSSGSRREWIYLSASIRFSQISRLKGLPDSQWRSLMPPARLGMMNFSAFAPTQVTQMSQSAITRQAFSLSLPFTAETFRIITRWEAPVFTISTGYSCRSFRAFTITSDTSTKHTLYPPSYRICAAKPRPILPAPMITAFLVIVYFSVFR